MSRPAPGPSASAAKTDTTISEAVPEPTVREVTLRRADLKPMAAAKTPVGSGVISLVGIVLALLLIALGVLGAQTALVAGGALTGSAWLTSAVTAVDGMRPALWMLPVGIVVALAGLVLMLTAVKPRSRTAVALSATTGVFLRPRDVARLAAAAGEDVDGVQDAQASASRTKVALRIMTTAEDGSAEANAVADAVTSAVDQRLSALKKPVRVTVRAQRRRR
ncbi:MAG: DUF6286 domain-containing protein [Actinomycetota bacterium]|nr:DUF6286 domain-containing protein [Actinomycetota bacterium]